VTALVHVSEKTVNRARKPFLVLRPIWPPRNVAIVLPATDALYIEVPNVAKAFHFKLPAGQVALRVFEEQDVDAGGVGRKDTKVDALLDDRRAQVIQGFYFCLTEVRGQRLGVIEANTIRVGLVATSQKTGEHTKVRKEAK
jgi:hypothetical protein